MLAGISADPLDDTRDWQAGEDFFDRITYPLLSDADLRACKAFGLHDAAHEICLPAIVLVHRDDGTIRWQRVSDSIADRPEVDEVLEQVRRLASEPR